MTKDLKQRKEYSEPIQKIIKKYSREQMHKRGQRYSPIIVPKDRKMTRAQYKLMDHMLRKSYRKNEPAMQEAVRNMMTYGTGLHGLSINKN